MVSANIIHAGSTRGIRRHLIHGRRKIYVTVLLYFCYLLNFAVKILKYLYVFKKQCIFRKLCLMYTLITNITSKGL